jgi:hypothetical protein
MPAKDRSQQEKTYGETENNDSEKEWAEHAGEDEH